MSDLHFDEESDYSEENNSDKEDFSSIFQPFQFEPQQRKLVVMKRKVNIFRL